MKEFDFSERMTDQPKRLMSLKGAFVGKIQLN